MRAHSRVHQSRSCAARRRCVRAPRTLHEHRRQRCGCGRLVLRRELARGRCSLGWRVARGGRAVDALPATARERLCRARGQPPLVASVASAREKVGNEWQLASARWAEQRAHPARNVVASRAAARRGVRRGARARRRSLELRQQVLQRFVAASLDEAHFSVEVREQPVVKPVAQRAAPEVLRHSRQRGIQDEALKNAVLRVGGRAHSIRIAH